MVSVRHVGEVKQPDPVDRHIGRQLRLARKLQGFSQEDLADKLGVTFQQVQKYEKGTNRVSASRLHQAALILGVPISFFFPTGDGPDEAPASSGRPERQRVMDFSASPEAADLIIAFSQIQDARLRRRVLELVRTMAGGAEAEVE
ncbi:MAG TPA: helix-turn-helix transcriptional regulator [Afifellaceae bacterium]|nr:helix-turn-helix transcriptional regulator [Afifellaceae bacterium]